jgi:Transposase, Mutator family
VIFIDALMVKIRDGVVTNRAVYLAIGIDCEGGKQVLGLWVGPTTGESAKFWLSVLSEIRARGVADACIVLRRADRPAGRDQRGLAAGHPAAVRRAQRKDEVLIDVADVALGT